jgi:uncharacterized protein (TIGR03435 family)
MWKNILTVMLLACSTGVAQTSPPTPARPTFDVAAIHPASPEERGGIVRPLPNGTGYQVQNMTAKTMMSVMYRIPAQQITGGPDWFGTEPFDVEAKADGSYDIERLHTMFQNLLADRFGLKFHIVTKEGPVFALVVDKGGIKMKQDGDTGDLSIPLTPVGPGEFVGKKVPMPYLCWFLGQQVRDDPRPVIDRTGLKGVYEFKLSFAPPLPPGVSPDAVPPEMLNRPTLKDAVREQLGLRLDSDKGPVEHYVIDRVEKPSAN